MQSGMNLLKQLLPLVIPLVLLELALLIVAIVDLIRRKRTKGPKWAWALVIVLINIIGPIVYLLFGREEADAGDPD
jgi:uncharacterized membrane protein YhaH (DUF805 family)